MQLEKAQYALAVLLIAAPNLIHYNKLDKGGHFAAWEQPQLITGEVRSGFRSLR